jgi:hypothetical protein
MENLFPRNIEVLQQGGTLLLPTTHALSLLFLKNETFMCT